MPLVLPGQSPCGAGALARETQDQHQETFPDFAGYNRGRGIAMPPSRQCISRKSRNPILWLLALVLLAAQSTAQTFPDNDPASLPYALFRTLGLAAPESDPPQCHVRVIANDVVVSAKDWHEVAHHVLPPGVVENPDQWPFFAWSDTPLGVVRTRDEKGVSFLRQRWRQPSL
jgi:hypothetical protein